MRPLKEKRPELTKVERFRLNLALCDVSLENRDQVAYASGGLQLAHLRNYRLQFRHHKLDELPNDAVVVVFHHRVEKFIQEAIQELLHIYLGIFKRRLQLTGLAQQREEGLVAVVYRLQQMCLSKLRDLCGCQLYVGRDADVSAKIDILEHV